MGCTAPSTGTFPPRTRSRFPPNSSGCSPSDNRKRAGTPGETKWPAHESCWASGDAPSKLGHEFQARSRRAVSESLRSMARVAILGLGGVAERIHLPACAALPDVQLVGAGGADDERRDPVSRRRV